MPKEATVCVTACQLVDERFVVNINCQSKKLLGHENCRAAGGTEDIDSTGAAASAEHAMTNRHNERKIGFTPRQGFWNNLGRLSVAQMPNSDKEYMEQGLVMGASHFWKIDRAADSCGAAEDVSPRREPWGERVEDGKAPEGRQKTVRESCFLSLLRSLSGLKMFPRLTPWANLFRRSAAKQSIQILLCARWLKVHFNTALHAHAQ